MISIAWRNLFHDKLRFAISISGVAFSVFLILVLLGLFRGWHEKIVGYIASTHADLWILQEGGDDFFNSISVLPVAYKDTIKENPNVKEVYPLIGRQTSFEIDKGAVRLYIIGYDPHDGVGGPFKIIRGVPTPGKGEIIIDKVFANTKEINIGDTLRILEKDLRVVGIAEGGDLVFLQFAFMERKEAEELLRMPEMVNFYIVTLNNSSSSSSVISDLEDKLENISVVTQAEYITSNQREINEIFIPILTVLVIIGFLVGLTVVGLMTYTSTIEKSKEYGILKAIGASNAYLYKIIIQQSFLTGLVGFFVGVGLTIITKLLLENIVPQFVIEMLAKDVGLSLSLILIMSIAAAYVPMRRIARIEPAAVFK